jgi:hypothetical protein
MSVILLETNGKASSTKPTKHIKVKYFYIKEEVENGEIQMCTDMNTKPKQGLVYCKFQGHVMGIPADYNNKDYEGIIPSIPPVISMLPVPKAQEASHECVGDNQKGKIQINHEKGTPYSLPCRSISARKSYLRTLANPASIPQEPALTNNVRRSKLEVQAPIKLVGGHPWSPRVYRALRLLGNMLEVLCP